MVGVSGTPGTSRQEGFSGHYQRRKDTVSSDGTQITRVSGQGPTRKTLTKSRGGTDLYVGDDSREVGRVVLKRFGMTTVFGFR